MSSTDPAAPPRLDDQLIGQGDAIFQLRTRPEINQAIDLMTAQARRNIRIVTPDLEPEAYNRQLFIDLLAAFVREQSRHARVQVLLRDPRRAVQETQRLVTFWHRFPSYCELRELRAEWADTREAFFMVDDRALIRQPDIEDPLTIVNFNALPAAPERATWFEQAWDHAAPCAALRRLSL